MDRLTGISVFVTVVERGSLTAAAEALDMSRAMVTRYLAEVERWSGARLLHRTTRRIGLTGAGELALERFRAMLALSQGLREALSDDASELRGRLRVTTSTSFGHAHLCAEVAGFLRQHRQVEVELLLVERTVDLVDERVDIAVRIARRLDERLIARRLATCRSVICAAPDYLQRHGVPQTPQALAGHRCLAHLHVGRHAWEFRDGEHAISVPVGGGFCTNEAGALMTAALAGAGLAMLPRYLVAPALASGALCQVLEDYALEEMGVYAVYGSRRQQPRAVRALLDFLAARFAGREDW